jgi:hypothetical protein
MTIVRAPRREHWTVVSNSTIEDQRLSYRALGLLTYLLSKPDHWRIEANVLSAGRDEGRDAVRRSLNELEAAGYLTRRRAKDAKGRWMNDSIISELPTGDGFPGAGSPGAGFSGDGFPGAITNPDSVSPESEVDVPNGTSTRAAAKRRERNPLFDAVVAACEMDYDEMTPVQRRACGVAVAQLKAVNAQPDDVAWRAEVYRHKYRDAALTPHALANQWAALAQMPSAAPKPMTEAQMALARQRALAEQERRVVIDTTEGNANGSGSRQRPDDRARRGNVALDRGSD